jgi:glycosyltransferase involved in cell wall biosynthesis
MTRSATPLDVSVITPAYNRAHLIERTLNSVRMQTRPVTRIIVVDDGSHDGTPETVRAWAKRHSFPVHVEVLSRNLGPAAARNCGIERADTGYVAFLDSDDELLPDALERLCAGLDAYPDAVVSFGDATVVSPAGRQPHALFAPHVRLAEAAELLPDGRFRLRNATDTLLAASIIPTSATCFRRAAGLAVGGMPVDFRARQDWLFLLRLAQRGRFVFTTDDLAVHHRHDDNLSGPYNNALVAREKLRGLLSLRADQLGVRLNSAQQARIAQMLERQCGTWRYHLSKLGLRSYWQGLRSSLGEATGGWAAHLLADPKSLVRAARFGVGRRTEHELRASSEQGSKGPSALR